MRATYKCVRITDVSAFIYRAAVDFSDSDAAGIAHFSSILRWVERAEAAWLRSVGVDPFVRSADGSVSGFPRVKVGCEYLRPLLPYEKYAIAILPESAGNTSFTYSFKVFSGEGVDGPLCAEGSATIVFASGTPGVGIKPVPLPEEIVRACKS